MHAQERVVPESEKNLDINQQLPNMVEQNVMGNQKRLGAVMQEVVQHIHLHLQSIASGQNGQKLVVVPVHVVEALNTIKES